MRNLLLLILFQLLLFSPSIAQWTYNGAFPDTSIKGDVQGMAVDPDGKIWVAPYYQLTPVVVSGDTVWTSGIYVYNPDGSEAEFSPILRILTSNGFVVDRLTGYGRGLGVDENGDIIYVQSFPSKIFKINYLTGEGIARHDLTEVGSSPTAPAVTEDGTIFVGPVVGNNNPSASICMYDSGLNFLGSAVNTLPGISRTMEVSPDGNTIYWMVLSDLGSSGIYKYQRDNQFANFEFESRMFQGMSIESSTWHPVTGDLWISHDSRGTGPYSSLTWYAYNENSNSLVDSFSLTPQGVPDEYPRGIDFSYDGYNAYVGTFSEFDSRIFKFTAANVPVELTSFTSSISDGKVILNWVTVTEINNSGFVIESSSDGEEFDELTFIEGTGNSTELSSYSYTDSPTNFGKIYYRLKQLDFDGTFEIYGPIEVEFTGSLDYALEQNYPNPFNPTTKIRFSIPKEENVKVIVTNSLGQQVAELLNSKLEAGRHELNFNAGNYSSGVYFYQIQAGEYSEVRKMMLLK